jgi:hypothetical protein
LLRLHRGLGTNLKIMWTLKSSNCKLQVTLTNFGICIIVAYICRSNPHVTEAQMLFFKHFIPFVSLTSAHFINLSATQLFTNSVYWFRLVSIKPSSG